MTVETGSKRVRCQHCYVDLISPSDGEPPRGVENRSTLCAPNLPHKVMPEVKVNGGN